MRCVVLMAPLFPVLRFSLLRIICVATLLLSIQNVVWTIMNERRPNEILNIVLFIVIFVHHFATALGPRLSLPGGADVALILSEITFTINGLSTAINSLSSRVSALNGILAYITAISLILLVITRFVQALKKGRSFLWTQYDIAGPDCRHTWSKSSNTNVDLEGGSKNQPVRTVSAVCTSDILLGRSIWKRLYHGESRWMIAFRGIFAASIIMLLALYTIFLVVIEPLRQTALIPTRESRSLGFPNDFPRGEKIRNIVIGMPIEKNSNFVDISPAVDVSYLRDDGSGMTNCLRAQNSTINSRLSADYDQAALAVTSFHCPPNVEDHGVYPDILVTVNFALLNVTPKAIWKTRWNSVQVMLGRTNDLTDVVRRTPATPLIPGVNLVGIADRQLRRLTENPTFAALGGFDIPRTFVTSGLAQVWPEPRTSTFIRRGSNVSTLRIVTQFDFSEWKIVQQNRDKSVLRGIAGIGGLWTFIGGTFAALFGSSLFKIMFGTKPIHVYGATSLLVHNKIKEACRLEYPRLESDLKADPANRGLAAFLHDHLIEFHYLDLSQAASGQSNDKPPGTSTPTGRIDASDMVPLLPTSAVRDAFSFRSTHSPRSGSPEPSKSYTISQSLSPARW